MHVWVIYDIESSKAGDRRRRGIIKQIEKFGLIRVQKSVFLGTLEPNKIEELEIFSRDLIDEKTDSVYIFPVCKTDFDNVKIIGLGFDKRLVSDEIENIVF